MQTCGGQKILFNFDGQALDRRCVQRAWAQSALNVINGCALDNTDNTAVRNRLSEPVTIPRCVRVNGDIA